MNTWQPINKPFLIACSVPDEDPRIVQGFDDFYEANHRVHTLNQKTNTQPYKLRIRVK